MSCDRIIAVITQKDVMYSSALDFRNSRLPTAADSDTCDFGVLFDQAVAG